MPNDERIKLFEDMCEAQGLRFALARMGTGSSADVDLVLLGMIATLKHPEWAMGWKRTWEEVAGVTDGTGWERADKFVESLPIGMEVSNDPT